MREIKFRAWDLDNGGMYFTDQSPNDTEMWILENGQIIVLLFSTLQGGTDMEQNGYYAPKQVLMQYSGMKDVDGIEIYDGDILQYLEWNGGGYDNKGNWQVSWDEYSPKMMIDQGGLSVSLEGVTDDQYKVIGNIYENPELINN